MTESEAIEGLKHSIVSYEAQNKNNITCDLTREILGMAIKALEKQMPKKPKDRCKTKYVWDSAYCPVCNCGITARWVHCQCCGQKLDWRDDE